MASSVVAETPLKDCAQQSKRLVCEFIEENGGGSGVRLKKAKREARKK